MGHDADYRLMAQNSPLSVHNRPVVRVATKRFLRCRLLDHYAGFTGRSQQPIRANRIY